MIRVWLPDKAECSGTGFQCTIKRSMCINKLQWCTKMQILLLFVTSCLDNLFKCLFIDLSCGHRLLHIAKDHIQVLVVGLQGRVTRR